MEYQLTQTGEQVQNILDQAPTTEQNLQSEITRSTEKDQELETAIGNEKTRAEGVEGPLVTAVGNLETDVESIKGVIPAQATPSNKLVDKNYVDDAIATNTADFKGTYPSLEALITAVPEANANDYAFVVTTDQDGNVTYSRYKYVDGTGWTFEYALNNSSFTAAQWAAINSGITAALVAKLAGLPNADALVTQMNALIAVEKNRAEAAEGTLTNGLNAEILARQNADTALQQNINAEALLRDNADDALQGEIDGINAKIPTQASASNQLADKAFVNSSIATNTGDFKGTYNSLAELQQVTNANSNDYAFVITTDSDGNKVYNRYKYVEDQGWVFEYALNNSSFTAAQWGAINSGITAALAAKINGLPDIDALNAMFAAITSKIPADASSANKLVDYAQLVAALATKQDTLIFDNVPTEGSNNPVKSGGVYNRLYELTVAIVGLQNSKQDVLTFDQYPTAGSDNPVRSGGINTWVGNMLEPVKIRISTNEADIAMLQAAYRALTESDVVVVGQSDTWPVANPQLNTIYRVADRAHTPPQNYSDYMYNGTAMVLMATYDNAIDNYPTAGSNNLAKSGGIDAEIKSLAGYYTCGTAASTASKTITANYYILLQGGSIKVKFTYKNTADDATLKIGSADAKPLFYAGRRAGSSNSWEAGEVVEIFYDGTNYMANNVMGGGTGDGVFDISVYNADNGVPHPYVDLDAALSGTNVPLSVRRGGMSVKFIQGTVQSSDNKYVQYRLMRQSFTTAEWWWQGVDVKPTGGSINLVESGGVVPFVNDLDQINIVKIVSNSYAYQDGHTADNQDYDRSERIYLTTGGYVNNAIPTSAFCYDANNEPLGSATLSGNKIVVQLGTESIYINFKKESNPDGLQNVFISKEPIEILINNKPKSILLPISSVVVDGETYSNSTGLVVESSSNYRTKKLLYREGLVVSNACINRIYCWNYEGYFLGMATTNNITGDINGLTGTVYFALSFEKGKNIDSFYNSYLYYKKDKFGVIDEHSIKFGIGLSSLIVTGEYWSSTGTNTSPSYCRVKYLKCLEKELYFINCSVASVRCYGQDFSYLGDAYEPRSNYRVLRDNTVYVGINFPVSENPDGFSNAKMFIGSSMFDYIKKSSGNILCGKNWAFCGDSFSAGANIATFTDEPYKGMPKSYPYIIARRTGMERLYNCAIGGSTITYIDGSRNEFSTPNGRYTQVNANADIITLWFGINDSHQQVPIGSIDDNVNTTFYGAWNIVLDYLIRNHPYAKIGIVITNGTDEYNGLFPYTEAERVVAKKFGIPYLDLELDTNIPYFLRQDEKAKAFNIPQSIVDFRTNIFAINNPSDTHPNADAHEFQSSFIESWLKSL